MTYRLIIHVPMLPPNSNRKSQVKYVNDREEREFADAVHYCAISARNEWEQRKIPPLWGPRATVTGQAQRFWPTLSKATVTIQFVTARPGPLPDYSNLWETTKKAKDRLTARPSGVGPMARVGAGLIKDDAPTCLTWAMPEAGAQVVRGDTSETIITVEGEA